MCVCVYVCASFSRVNARREMSAKLSSTGESNRIITQALRLKQEELEALSSKHEAMVRQYEAAGGVSALAAAKTAADTAAVMAATAPARDATSDNQLLVRPHTHTHTHTRDVVTVRLRLMCVRVRVCVQEGGADMSEPSAEAVRAAGGKGRFYVESKPSQGLLLIKAARPNAKELLDRLDVNEFLRKAQKSVHFKERVIEKVSHLLGLVLVEEEDRAAAMKEHGERREQVGKLTHSHTHAVWMCAHPPVCVFVCQVDHLSRKAVLLGERVGKEEDAKRRTLLRYVDCVKRVAEANAAAAQVGAVDQDTLARGAVVQLADSGIGDEEVRVHGCVCLFACVCVCTPVY